MKYALGQHIYYLLDNRLHSASVLARRNVENERDDPHTSEQAKLFTPWGPAGVWYATCHGHFREQQVFASKDELVESLTREVDLTAPSEKVLCE